MSLKKEKLLTKIVVKKDNKEQKLKKGFTQKRCYTETDMTDQLKSQHRIVEKIAKKGKSKTKRQTGSGEGECKGVQGHRGGMRTQGELNVESSDLDHIVSTDK